jgi:hypothetical protein
LIDLLIVGMLSPMDRGKRVYHESLKVPSQRRGYYTQTAHDQDGGDHRMDFHMYYVGRCIPYLLRWRWRCSMAVVDLVYGRLGRCLYRGKVRMQVDAHHIVGHGCMRIDSLWNLRHRIEVEVGEWGWSSSLIIESFFAFRDSDMDISDIVSAKKDRSTTHKCERRVCVSRLWCTAGKILAVFLGSCRSASCLNPLHDTNHGLTHASTCSMTDLFAYHTKMGYAAVQCVGLRMDNANGADHFRGFEYYLIFVYRTPSLSLMSDNDSTSHSWDVWDVHQLAMKRTRLTRTPHPTSECRV